MPYVQTNGRTIARAAPLNPPLLVDGSSLVVYTDTTYVYVYVCIWHRHT